MTRGPLSLTLQTPEAFTTSALRELADGVEAIHSASLSDKNYRAPGPAHWMMIDIVNVLRDEINKREDAPT